MTIYWGDLSGAERQIQLPCLRIAQSKAIFAIERLRSGVFGLDDDCIDTECVPRTQNSPDGILQEQFTEPLPARRYRARQATNSH